MTDYELRMWRSTLATAPDTVLSADEAVLVLPMPEAEARAWLASQRPTGVDGIYRWGDLQEAILRRHRPITTWVEVARVLGISVDAVNRRRRKSGDQHPATFPGPAAVTDWWEGLHVVGPKVSSRRPRKAAASGKRKKVDFHAIGREPR